MSIKSVKVRMYKQLLGDCFLLTVEGEEGKPTYVLIDCGILQNVDGAKERMIAIANDIRDTTGGFVDLLIVTHEHFDHVSGFVHAKDILLDPDIVKYGEVWMAWTENPDDDRARELRQSFNDRKLAMTNVALALGESGHGDLVNPMLQDLQKFIGPLEPAPTGLSVAPQGRLTVARVMDEVKKAAAKVAYQLPGAVTAIPGKASLPAAILAPPKIDSRLFKDLPSKGDARETYLAEQHLQFSLLGLDPDGDGTALDRATPFAPRFSKNLEPNADSATKWGKEKGNARAWVHAHYFAQHDAEHRDQHYRMIDDVWAGSASSLALKLDSDTNNTSLVVAFRLPDGKFLLFAADAQVGNWLSWHDQSYALDGETLSASDILSRTILYKVGHHGSHNATLKAKGLELMVDPDLSAMISTVETIAEEQGTPPGWQMPYDGVRNELLRRCKGRVLRGDRMWASDDDTKPYRPDASFQGRLDEAHDLYVELQVYPREKTRKAKKGKGK
ncbi:MBL fold metallo-hydrolase [Sphingomonas jaspsi]|uniref:MBL fold metallo-hydrolase n=1 Tax=Sphingomonas jaspsi TaxID=392409 RepID=UPI0004BB6A9B|nr:MBL fold metallo-hydrolase [Sphingomonas jaspsi]